MFTILCRLDLLFCKLKGLIRKLKLTINKKWKVDRLSLEIQMSVVGSIITIKVR